MSIIQSIKATVFAILETEKNPEKKGIIYNLDDYFITSLIMLNMVAIVLESFSELYLPYRTYFDLFEAFSVFVFTIEYLLRLWISDLHFPGNHITSRLKFAKSPLGIVDLLSILPFYLPFITSLDMRILRILRLMRIVRILKLGAYLSSLSLIYNVLLQKKQELIVTVATATILMVLSATLMYYIENDIQPEAFPNIFASLWWSVATLTTIGYGDVYPITILGKFLAAITALFGIGLVAIPTGLISMGFIDEISKRKSQTNSDIEAPTYCPHCGKKLK